MLLIAGAADRIVPAAVNRRNLRKYAASGTVTDFREFPGRAHWIIAQDGWEEVAAHVGTWLAGHGLGAASP